MLRILGKILRHALIYFFYVSAWCVNIIEGRSVFFCFLLFSSRIYNVRQANKVFYFGCISIGRRRLRSPIFFYAITRISNIFFHHVLHCCFHPFMIFFDFHASYF